MKKNEQLLIRLGQKIQNRRNQQNISQEKLANKSGIDRSYLGAVERGERNVGILILYKISKALKVNLGDLIKDLDE